MIGKKRAKRIQVEHSTLAGFSGVLVVVHQKAVENVYNTLEVVLGRRC